ncbi:DSBA-like thioredoxin domain-containing protein [Scenedesmus sp. NREL 46B-D3]|nr:DSBA-like thioredoxin domain-containing protein [Scenedesmus sp. NREL 46B-D3]
MLLKAVSHLKGVHPATSSRPRSLAVMAAAKPTIKIEVVSDVVCPWCYVGKRRLEKAMQQFEGKAQFDVHWLPYQLNPAAGPEAINKLQYYNDKFGPARVAQIIPNMQQTFASEGLQYSIGGNTGNTRRAHRLMSWVAKEHGLAKQDAAAEQLFEGYHCK